MNDHMGVNAYYTVFNQSQGSFFKAIQFHLHVEGQPITIFTLESHLTYLKEIRKGEKINVFIRILDFDSKRIHSFQEIRNVHGNTIATCESMLLAVNKNTRRTGKLPDDVIVKLQERYENTKDDPWPKQAGNRIGIKQRTRNQR